MLIAVRCYTMALLLQAACSTLLHGGQLKFKTSEMEIELHGLHVFDTWFGSAEI